jgi:hypothetical protein
MMVSRALQLVAVPAVALAVAEERLGRLDLPVVDHDDVIKDLFQDATGAAGRGRRCHSLG